MSYLIALCQHNNSLGVVIPHHLPELLYRVLQWMLRHDEFTIPLETFIGKIDGLMSHKIIKSEKINK